MLCFIILRFITLIGTCNWFYLYSACKEPCNEAEIYMPVLYLCACASYIERLLYVRHLMMLSGGAGGRG